MSMNLHPSSSSPASFLLVRSGGPSMAKTYVAAGLILLMACIVTGCGNVSGAASTNANVPSGSQPTPTPSPTATPVPSPSPSPTVSPTPAPTPTPSPTPALPVVDHVVLVILENHGFDQVIGSAAMPYLNSLAANHSLATNYFADTHPSIGNYFMLTVGQTITNNDAFNLTVNDDNLVRALLAAGKTW